MTAIGYIWTAVPDDRDQRPGIRTLARAVGSDWKGKISRWPPTPPASSIGLLPAPWLSRSRCIRCDSLASGSSPIVASRIELQTGSAERITSSTRASLRVSRAHPTARDAAAAAGARRMLRVRSSRGWISGALAPSRLASSPSSLGSWLDRPRGCRCASQQCRAPSGSPASPGSVPPRLRQGAQPNRSDADDRFHQRVTLVQDCRPATVSASPAVLGARAGGDDQLGQIMRVRPQSRPPPGANHGSASLRAARCARRPSSIRPGLGAVQHRQQMQDIGQVARCASGSALSS